MNTINNSNAVREPSIYQIDLFPRQTALPGATGYRDRLMQLLAGDLDYHGYDTSYASHDFHAFPAKFPPPLPDRFIRGLTAPGDTVLDPMMGSGTTIVEAFLAQRRCIGTDIDPLALLIARVKTTPLEIETLRQELHRTVENANRHVAMQASQILTAIHARWDKKTAEFVDYWFAAETQIELAALLLEIEAIDDPAIRDFFTLAFSACIITKSGGVSLAFDLAHTRPHRAKIAFTASGRKIIGDEYNNSDSPRIKFLTKNVRSAITEFYKRATQNIQSLNELPKVEHPITLHLADAQNLPVESETVDLIVTSPPYAVMPAIHGCANATTQIIYSFTPASPANGRFGVTARRIPERRH